MIIIGNHETQTWSFQSELTLLEFIAKHRLVTGQGTVVLTADASELNAILNSIRNLRVPAWVQRDLEMGNRPMMYLPWTFVGDDALCIIANMMRVHSDWLSNE